MSMMISFDDAIELFKELGQYVKAEEAGKYDCAINRLNYENEKAKNPKHFIKHRMFSVPIADGTASGSGSIHCTGTICP